MTSTPPARPIPEDRIPAILARAAELDRQRRETITPDALRVAALDAGISAAAVDAALAEYSAEHGPAAKGRPGAGARKPGWRTRAAALLRRLLPVAGLGVAGLVVGFAGEAGEAMPALTIAGVMAYGVWMIRSRRPRRAAAGFVARLAVLSLVLALGWDAADVDDDFIGVLFGVTVPLAALGSLIIKVRLPRRRRGEAARAHAG